MIKPISDKIARFTPGFWLKIGGLIPNWVYEDAKRGKMQNNGQGYHYKSETYKRYKANGMKRFTKGDAKLSSIKGKKDLFFKNPKAGLDKKGIGTGDRLKSYKGVSIESTNTSFVDMILTGRTIKSLKPKSSDETGVVMAFGQDKAGVILGNAKRNYNIVGLNNNNRKKIRNIILAQLDNNLKKEIGKTIIINIGK